MTTGGATHTEHGNGEVARAGGILRTVVGSGVHGIAIAGTDDHDEMGVFVEPADRVLGLLGPVPHYVVRTRPEGARSGPGGRYGYDVKYASHALRLALQGLEILRDGRLTLPMPPAERERVLAVKRGDVPRRDDVVPRSTGCGPRSIAASPRAPPRCCPSPTSPPSRPGPRAPTGGTGAGEIRGPAPAPRRWGTGS